MERKQALTIPFAVKKDKIMENPLRIPTSYLECGRLEQQVPWTEITSYKSRRRDSPHKNGSMLFEHNHAALVRLGLAVRKPCLILTDVLKTEPGKAYMERIKRRLNLNGKERGRGTDHSVVSKDTRSCQTKVTDFINKKSKCLTPKKKQTPNSSSSHRSRLKKKAQSEEEDEQDLNKAVSGQNEKIAFVDCGLSVSWEPENAKNCKFASPKTKETLNEPENASQKRKISNLLSECPETPNPKRPRESVLRLSGVQNKDGGHISPKESPEERDLKNIDSGIVQFTVGEGDKNIEPQNISSQSDDTTTKAAEPIVLSSDEDDDGEGDKNIVNLRQISQTTVSPLQKAANLEDMQVLQLVVDGIPDTTKNTDLRLAFSTLHCGRYQAMANSDLLVTDENIIIPLKDYKEEMDLMLTLERKALKRYSVWEKHELETLKLFCKRKKESIPAAGLLCCVSEAAAEGVQYDLSELCDKQDSRRCSEIPSPFILIFLREPLEGMEGAFLRSLLDMDCLNSLAQEKSFRNFNRTILGPVLSLDESLELIKSSGLDPHLLKFLGQETEHASDFKQLASLENTSYIEPEKEPQKNTVFELENVQEHEKPSQTQEVEKPKEALQTPEKNVIEPVYTLCHRRLEDSYSVTMCRPDSSWVRYKHQGLARRLIQFPPPPMKGGITVTMEDLQCLDSGTYLNDVIIDFYLKYLIHNASESVAGRSHIFSSFFYKQLTRRDNASEGNNSDSCQRQKRYQRVRTWTRHVDIFAKDFLFVPVNQEAHWYLVVICFPGLEQPKTETWFSGKTGQSQDQEEAQGSKSPNNRNTETENSQEDIIKDPPSGTVNCTEQTCHKKSVCKRPCILVMDSLKRSPHERVFKLLREYLQSEWEARRGSSRDFGAEQMENSHCQVPLQDNSSDCGLYLLHYVESFLKDPIVHFELPLHLKSWFPRHQVRRKRDEIRDLVLKLFRLQNVDNTK